MRVPENISDLFFNYDLIYWKFNQDLIPWNKEAWGQPPYEDSDTEALRKDAKDFLEMAGELTSVTADELVEDFLRRV